MTNWKPTKLGEILTKSDEWIELKPEKTYRQVTVRLWGKGVTLRGEITGAEIAASKQCVVHARQFIASRIDARNGAFGLITESGVRLARNVNVGHGTLDWSQMACIPDDRRGEFARFELQDGDILVSLDRPVISTGVKVARVSADDLPCLLLQRVARAQFLGDRVLPDYFYRWLRSPHFVSAIDPGRTRRNH